MITFPEPQDLTLRAMPPRCLQCAYILSSLETPRCPECGRRFDPANPVSYTRKPAFVFWRYWLPGFLLAVASGTVLAGFFIMGGMIGVGATLVLPFSVGAMLGYGMRAGKAVLLCVAMGGILGLILGLHLAGILGVLCAVVLSIAYLVPAAIGASIGALLRARMKESQFSQRWYLPMLGFLLLPLAAQLAERACGFQSPPESLSTSTTILAPLHRVWKSQLMADSQPPDPQDMMRVGLPHPVSLDGRSFAVGDVRVCRFSKGVLRVQITERTEDRALAFRFIGQSKVEDRAIRLLDARFEFEPMDAGHTRVTLTTRYQPLMTPRWYWRYFERRAGESMHRYLLEDIRRNAEAGVTLPVAIR